jgi:hypothetical protein
VGNDHAVQEISQFHHLRYNKLTLGEDGRIAEQRDYYDLWGDIFDNIPWFKKMYRRFMHRKFG